jgi:hypothetical protein
MILKRKRIATVRLPDDVMTECLVRLGLAIYCRAQRDVRSSSLKQSARDHARSFLENSEMCQLIEDANDLHSNPPASADFVIVRRYFIEVNDPYDAGRRGLTQSVPLVIRGYVQPIKRSRRGVSSVIIVEEPAEFAALWKAIPTDEWVDLGDDYAGVVGEISEGEYARLLAHVPGIEAQHVSVARRRAMDEADKARGSDEIIE